MAIASVSPSAIFSNAFFGHGRSLDFPTLPKLTRALRASLGHQIHPGARSGGAVPFGRGRDRRGRQRSRPATRPQDALLQRFIRGDKPRLLRGSGLGPSLAAVTRLHGFALSIENTDPRLPRRPDEDGRLIAPPSSLQSDRLNLGMMG